MGQIKTDTDVADFLRGADFMSASGGGNPAVQHEQLLEDLRQGRDIGFVPLQDIDPDGITFSVCYSGSIAPESFDDPEERAVRLGGGKVHDLPFVQAVRLLEEYLGVRCAGLVSIEIGGINSGAILSAASRLGLPLVDGDYSGRAIPELNATALHVFGAQPLPMACVDHFGNKVILRSSPSDAWAERIGKYLALASLGMIACSFAALPVPETAKMYVPGTMSECLNLGRAIREAREAGKDPVQAAAAVLNGWALFLGTVTDRDWANTGYMEGTHELTGTGDFADHVLKVWFRNENHVSWLDGSPGWPART